MKRLTEIVILRVTPGELKHLKKCSSAFSCEKAATGKENFSEYLRAKLLKESGYRNVELERTLADIRYEMRKIGTNVNQIAKKINSGFGQPGDIADLKEDLDQIHSDFEKFEKEVEEVWQSQS